MMGWGARILALAFVVIAAVRSVRDGYVFGAVAVLPVGALIVAERVRPETYFFTMGGAALLSSIVTFVAWRRERDLPLVHTQRRELLWPFIAVTAITVGGMIVSALAYGISQP
jgi:hypothetical protein